MIGAFMQKHRRPGWMRASRPVIIVGIIIGCIAFAGNGAWAGWFGSSSSGGYTTTNTPSFGSQPAPTTSGTAGEIVVHWATATFGMNNAQSFVVKRYDSSAAVQTVSGACAGTVSATGCVELNVPAGTWTYTVTPVLANSLWVGTESAKSNAVTTTGVASSNKVWFWVTP